MTTAIRWLPVVAALVVDVAGARGLAVTVTDGAGVPLAEAVVILRGPAAANATGATADAPAMRQRDKDFVPHVLAVAAGARVSFPNDDPFQHHVYSFSPGNAFDLALYSRDAVPEVSFATPGVVALGCNIHDQMRGYIYVSDSPTFAVTGATGAVEFQGLGAGAVEAEAWHPRQNAAAPKQTLAADATAATFSIALKASPPAALDRYESGEY
jgi:plastocyanin